MYELIKILIIVLSIIIAVLLIGCLIILNQLIWRKTISIPKFIINMIAGNNTPEEDEYQKAGKEAGKKFRALPLEKVSIKTADGANLIAHILVPPKSNGKLIIACHGARSSGIGEFVFMSQYLYESGYTAVFPDHRGCGESDGKYMGYGTHESRDTFLWLDYAQKRFYGMPIFLLGVSMGAATVMMMSDKIKEDCVKGIIEDCGYTSAWDEFSYQLKTSFHLPNFPILHICSMYSKMIAGYSFKEASPIDCVKNARKPILFIHGEKDDFVPFFMRDILYDACTADKYRLTVEGAVHARSYYKNPAVYEEAIEDFMLCCLKE